MSTTATTYLDPAEITAYEKALQKATSTTSKFISSQIKTTKLADAYSTRMKEVLKLMQNAKQDSALKNLTAAATHAAKELSLLTTEQHHATTATKKYTDTLRSLNQQLGKLKAQEHLSHRSSQPVISGVKDSTIIFLVDQINNLRATAQPHQPQTTSRALTDAFQDLIAQVKAADRQFSKIIKTLSSNNAELKKYITKDGQKEKSKLEVIFAGLERALQNAANLATVATGAKSLFFDSAKNTLQTFSEAATVITGLKTLHDTIAGAEGKLGLPQTSTGNTANATAILMELRKANSAHEQQMLASQQNLLNASASLTGQFTLLTRQVTTANTSLSGVIQTLSDKDAKLQTLLSATGSGAAQSEGLFSSPEKALGNLNSIVGLVSGLKNLNNPLATATVASIGLVGTWKEKIETSKSPYRQLFETDISHRNRLRYLKTKQEGKNIAAPTTRGLFESYDDYLIRYKEIEKQNKGLIHYELLKNDDVISWITNLFTGHTDKLRDTDLQTLYTTKLEETLISSGIKKRPELSGEDTSSSYTDPNLKDLPNTPSIDFKGGINDSIPNIQPPKHRPDESALNDRSQSQTSIDIHNKINIEMPFRGENTGALSHTDIDIITQKVVSQLEETLRDVSWQVG